jgi:hypothetical protein
MEEMWNALQWLYDNGKVPDRIKSAWETMMGQKTAIAVYAVLDALNFIGRDVHIVYVVYVAADAASYPKGSFDAGYAARRVVRHCMKLGYAMKGSE